MDQIDIELNNYEYKLFDQVKKDNASNEPSTSNNYFEKSPDLNDSITKDTLTSDSLYNETMMVVSDEKFHIDEGFQTDRNPPTFSRIKNLRASIWEYYTRLSKEQAKCKCCSAIIKTPTGSTTSMARHLNKHPEEFQVFIKQNMHRLESLKTKSSTKKKCDIIKSKMSQTNRKKNKDECLSNEQMRTITEKIAMMIITDYQPVSIVDDQGFRELIQVLEPKYEMPSQATIIKYITQELYEKKKRKLKEKIRQHISTRLESITVTVNSWKTHTAGVYLTLKCRYLTNDFLLMTCTLGTISLPNHYTDELICEKLSLLLKEWRLTHVRNIYIISDNVCGLNSNLAKSSWLFSQCFIHTIQLTFNDAKEETGVVSLIKKAKTIFNHYKFNTEARVRLQSFQDTNDTSQSNIFLKDCIDDHQLLYYLVQQEDAISSELSISDPVKCFTHIEWELAFGFTEIMEITNEIILKICTDEIPSLSVVIPTIRKIKIILDYHCSKMSNKSAIFFAENLLKAFRLHFPFNLKNITPRITKDLYLAMVLDPRFKTSFLSLNEIKIITTILKSQLEQVQNQGAQSKCDIKKLNNAQKYKILHDNITDESTLHDKIKNLEECDIEFQKYYKDPVISGQDSPYNWWNKNKNNFKYLSILAQTYLSIPASQISSTKLFEGSRVESVIKKENLCAEHIKPIVFLHENLTLNL